MERLSSCCFGRGLCLSFFWKDTHLWSPPIRSRIRLLWHLEFDTVDSVICLDLGGQPRLSCWSVWKFPGRFCSLPIYPLGTGVSLGLWSISFGLSRSWSPLPVSLTNQSIAYLCLYPEGTWCYSHGRHYDLEWFVSPERLDPREYQSSCLATSRFCVFGVVSDALPLTG